MRRINFFLCWVGVFACSHVLAGPMPSVSKQTPKYPSGTTLSRSIGVDEIVRYGLIKPYVQLSFQSPWPILVRQDLALAKPYRANRQKGLAAFIQFTDMHIIDQQSPGYAPYMRHYALPKGNTGGMSFYSSYRAQGMLTKQVSEAMVRQVRAFDRSPMLGLNYNFVISTGDSADGKMTDELHNFIALMSGGYIDACSSGRQYVGVEDQVIPKEAPGVYQYYYHPKKPPKGVEPDQWKRLYGYPEYPKLLQYACRDFKAKGVKYPWYTAYGNHDGLYLGNFALKGESFDFIDAVNVGKFPKFGSVMILDKPKGLSIGEYLSCFEDLTKKCAAAVIENTPKRQIPANPGRAVFKKSFFIEAHLKDKKGVPTGHGLSEKNLANNTIYYAFPISDKIIGITLNTVNDNGGANGSLSLSQAKWLEGQLKKRSAVYYNKQGKRVKNSHADNKLVIIFSHHDSKTMDNVQGKNHKPDTSRLNAKSFIALLHRFPNVVAWVNGHQHINRVWAHKNPKVKQAGFWEINTASHVDYPQQSRIIEVADNHDGTLSIFAILFDHIGDAKPRPGDYSIRGMAAMSREFSVNDPGFVPVYRIGNVSDRNVELIVKKPFK